jgi:hypothetical protein
MMNLLRLRAKQLKWLPINLLIRNLVRWESLDDPLPGYSVVLACVKSLAPLAIANLRLCARQNTPRMHEMIVVFDCPVEDIPTGIEGVVREVSPALSVRLLGYDKRQHSVAKRIDWGWVYSWLSWSLAIGQSRTQAVILHDLDAIPIKPELFETLYDHWLEAGAEFCGIGPYLSNGVTREMNLVTTFEMTLDAAHMRRRFRPFDLFNKFRLVDGRVVNFDTLLNPQWLSPRRAQRPIEETWLVHPSLVIGNYIDLVRGRRNFRGQDHTVLMLPYFLYLGGDALPLNSAAPQIAQADAQGVFVFGRELGIDGITPQHWAWMEKQIRRTEQALFGETRPEVKEYLVGFIRRAGRSRTVGAETGAIMVEDR